MPHTAALKLIGYFQTFRTITPWKPPDRTFKRKFAKIEEIGFELHDTYAGSTVTRHSYTPMRRFASWNAKEQGRFLSDGRQVQYLLEEMLW